MYMTDEADYLRDYQGLSCVDRSSYVVYGHVCSIWYARVMGLFMVVFACFIFQNRSSCVGKSFVTKEMQNRKVFYKKGVFCRITFLTPRLVRYVIQNNLWRPTMKASVTHRDGSVTVHYEVPAGYNEKLQLSRRITAVVSPRRVLWYAQRVPKL